MEDLSTVKFVDTPLKKLPSWIGQNMTSVAGIRRTFGVTFLNFQHAQRYRFPGPIAPLFVICATVGAMVQHEFHEGTKSLFFVCTFLYAVSVLRTRYLGAWPLFFDGRIIEQCEMR